MNNTKAVDVIIHDTSPLLQSKPLSPHLGVGAAASAAGAAAVAGAAAASAEAAELATAASGGGDCCARARLVPSIASAISAALHMGASTRLGARGLFTVVLLRNECCC